MTKFTCLLAIALLLVVGCCSAFSPTLHTRSTPLAASTTTSLHMAVAKKRKPPTYDYKTERWTPASEEDSAANGYDALGSLLRQGPKAYFSRVSNPDTYEQGCYKFMSREGCSYQQAQGNMDRMAENAQDWAFERLENERLGRTIDYSAMPDAKQLALTVSWSAVVLAVLGRVIYKTAIGGYGFYDGIF